MMLISVGMPKTNQRGHVVLEETSLDGRDDTTGNSGVFWCGNRRTCDKHTDGYAYGNNHAGGKPVIDRYTCGRSVDGGKYAGFYFATGK